MSAFQQDHKNLLQVAKMLGPHDMLYTAFLPLSNMVTQRRAAHCAGVKESVCFFWLKPCGAEDPCQAN